MSGLHAGMRIYALSARVATDQTWYVAATPGEMDGWRERFRRGEGVSSDTHVSVTDHGSIATLGEVARKVLKTGEVQPIP